MQAEDQKKAKIISTLAKNVRYLVGRSGLTQKKYAEELDCTPKSFNGYVNGVADFPTEIFMQISEKEGISPAVLYYSDVSISTADGLKEESGSVAREPYEPPAGYQAQSRSVEQLSETVEKLAGMLEACIEEKEQLRMKVV